MLSVTGVGSEMDHKKLKKWRTDLGMTQREAAECLGYARESYIRLERGHKPITLTCRLACAAIAAGLSPLGAKSRRQQAA